ncbi:DUF4059 family protein [Lactococcus fujiensis]|uniref:Uncharacterized protein n=1 Tax=Lactococcus fujiensis JCM 16395 TaxID=1291764 RepID=A0A2A5RNI3_9LACT|nr:DUF4059 family protein [Lactococcus fujiensis]PCS00907.1 hypothetical protein RT41_GL000697 [Lactococcus fujiensis JCM 16395]
MVLQLYLQGLLISAILVLILSAIYAFAYLVRHSDLPWSVRRNRIFDLILVDLLTIPVLSFAFLGLLIILKTRAL